MLYPHCSLIRQSDGIIIFDIHDDVLGTILTNRNQVNDEIRKAIDSGNPHYYSFKKLLSSHVLSKMLKVKTYKTIIYKLLWMDIK
jgi:hypothetical protein